MHAEQEHEDAPTAVRDQEDEDGDVDMEDDKTHFTIFVKELMMKRIAEILPKNVAPPELDHPTHLRLATHLIQMDDFEKGMSTIERKVGDVLIRVARLEARSAPTMPPVNPTTRTVNRDKPAVPTHTRPTTQPATSQGKQTTRPVITTVTKTKADTQPKEDE